MSTQNDELIDLIGELRNIEHRIVSLTGGAVDAVMDREGTPYLLSRGQQDLRERTEMQRRYAEQQTAILNALPAHIALLNAQGRIIDVNDAWRHFGQGALSGGGNGDSDGGVGANYLEVCDAAPDHVTEAHSTAAGIRDVLSGRRESFSLEYPCHTPASRHWFNLVVAPLQPGVSTGAVVMHVDITERKLAEIDLQRAASLFHTSNDGVVITDPEGIIRDVNPAFCMISGFSSEDVLSHPATVHPGLNEDPVRREIDMALEVHGRWSGELRARRRNGEVYVQKVSVSVITGDAGQVTNYIIVISDITRLKVHQAELDRVDRESLAVSVSVGVALFPDDGEDADALLRYGDQAMYRAKYAGRDRYVRFDLREARQSEERQSRLHLISEALEKKEFVLYYQPKVDLRDGQLIGLEALVRWQHPEHGLVPPGDFLGFVIGSELEVPFGAYVLDTALEQLSQWQSEGLSLHVSINVSGNELRQPGLADRIVAGLARHEELSANQLEIEVLEIAAVEDVNQVLMTLMQCRDAGLQVSLDDFGTGYSSLTVFRRLPVDTLKIDQSFVRDMLVDSDDRSIVESVIHMARAFNRNVVAEGVETMEHARALLQMGCHQVQGYGIARPMPADSVPAWIGEWQQGRTWVALNTTH
jgi:PAS domain S-box-containing protein